MVPLSRHQLVVLSHDGWRRVCDQPWGEVARTCLAHWAAHRLPLVVTRQPRATGVPRQIALGLAAPLLWERHRIALAVPRDDVAWFDEFPRVDKLALARPARARDWRRMCMSLKALGATARVYGSHGWQLLSGLPYVHEASDIDVWVAVTDAEHADAVVAILGAFDDDTTARLDGELFFAGGCAVAWREWRNWRAGASKSVLAKTLTGALLVSAAEQFNRPALEVSPW